MEEEDIFASPTLDLNVECILDGLFFYLLATKESRRDDGGTDRLIINTAC